MSWRLQRNDIFAGLTKFPNNAGFLVGSRGVAMIDQCGTEQRSRAFLEAARGPEGRPVHTLVNTHHHADHTFGNFVLPDETTIVAHRRARDEVIATGTAIAAAFEGPDWGDIEVTPPFLCFTDRLSLFIDDLEVELIHFGHPAHTTNDIVAWIPERGVLFSGDLIFKGGTPFALQGSVADLTDSERIVGNLHRAYSELRGEPSGVALALPPVIGDMQSLIGGPIVSRA